MDLKVYEKTRYQNIYRNKKNKNYVIMMSKPIKTSISRIENKKIMKIEDAVKTRDNEIIRQQRALESTYKETFDTMWGKYMNDCKLVKKQAYNTITRKQKIYKKYLQNQIDISLSKTNKDFWVRYIDDINTTNENKNQIIRTLKAFFNWCIEENILIINPLHKISKYKVSRSEMKYWIPSELATFLKTLNDDIETGSINDKKRALLIKTFTLIGFSVGCRTGEIRALTYSSIDNVKQTLTINHSINYDTSSKDFLVTTKNYQSQRVVDISQKLIEEIKKYKSYIEFILNKKLNNSDIIFYNYTLNKPYSDVSLRKKFYYYCDKAKVKRIRMYDLRHTFVTTMMTEGWELYHISEKLGHSNYSTTVNKYGHISNQIRKELAQSTDKYY